MKAISRYDRITTTDQIQSRRFGPIPSQPIGPTERRTVGPPRSRHVRGGIYLDCLCGTPAVGLLRLRPAFAAPIREAALSSRGHRCCGPCCVTAFMTLAPHADPVPARRIFQPFGPLCTSPEAVASSPATPSASAIASSMILPAVPTTSLNRACRVSRSAQSVSRSRNS